MTIGRPQVLVFAVLMAGAGYLGYQYDKRRQAAFSIEHMLATEGIRLNDTVQMKAVLDLQLEGNVIFKREHLVRSLEIIVLEQSQLAKHQEASRGMAASANDPSGGLRK